MEKGGKAAAEYVHKKIEVRFKSWLLQGKKLISYYSFVKIEYMYEIPTKNNLF